MPRFASPRKHRGVFLCYIIDFMAVKNKDLKKFYDSVYKKGEKLHYTPLLLSGDKVPPAKVEVLQEISWRGKTVLDAGCGTGELTSLIAKRGAKKVVGVDYSKDAIEVAQKSWMAPNLEFFQQDINDIKEKFDVIVSLGTLEHLNEPLAALMKFKKLLSAKGHIIITCPNWTNPRGYILQTLRMLFDAKITLADIHYFSPLDFQNFAKKLNMKLTWRTVDHSWSQGEKLVADFTRRLPNVLLKDKKFKTSPFRVAQFVNWIEKTVVPLELNKPHSGAVGLYHFRNN